MNDKSKLIENIVVDLSTSFKPKDLQEIRLILIKALSNYDVFETKQEYSLITIDDYNQNLLKIRFQTRLCRT